MSEIILTLLGGTGIGMLLQTVVQHFLNKSTKQENRCFEERKEAYAAFLESLRRFQANPDIAESHAQLLYCANRVQLVCSDSVFLLLEELRKTSHKSLFGQTTTDTLIVAMRSDLGVSR